MELISHFYPSLAICLFLAYTIRCNPNFARPDSRYFMLALHLVIVLIGADVAELLLSTLPYFTQWRVFFSVVGYALRPAALYCLVFILRPCLSRKAAVWLSLPLACHVLLLLTAFFTPWVFGYTADNQLFRGPLGLLPFGVCFFYLVLLLYFSLDFSAGRGRLSLPAAVALCFNFVITAALSVWLGSDALFCAGLTIDIAYLYLSLYIHRNNLDELTGAYVRRCFHLDAKRDAASLCALISLDMNNLKVINDTGGHHAGDAVLSELGRRVRSVLPPENTDFYRVGGDEFMIICRRMEEDEVQKLTREIRRAVSDTGFGMAVGYTMHGGDIEATAAAADAAMYLDKNREKGV